jgi:acyl-CoA synthetase (NDP forming)
MSSRLDNLKRMLEPKSVAVIGASANTDKAGFQALKALDGFKGAAWPVNPQGGTILGLDCLRSTDEIPEAVDLAILAVPSEAVGAFEQLSKKGCGGALIVSGGFGEAGEAGLLQAARMARSWPWTR